MFLTWVPTTQQKADAASRRRPRETYQFALFKELVAEFRVTPEVDRFATRQDRLTLRYNSEFQELDAEGSAWESHWGQVVNWWNPPFSVIPRVLMKIVAEGAGGILLVPEWKSRTWFSTLEGLPVLRRKRYPKGQSIYRNAAGERMPGPKWGTIALLISPRCVQ
mmetsp:Transcript_8499/g.25549  ORF Transcript_8499/g.25549 Transcript_8499/m.25549 type:complete len:164 (+) Transcript_8499:1371-1862(+)